MGLAPGDAARAYLASQVAALRTLAPAAASGDDDAVHDARTATRRLRAALLVCHPTLPPGGARTARRDLRDLGRALGAVRDPAVALAWLRRAAAAEPAAGGTDRLVEHLETTRRAALVPLRRALASPGHRDLLDTLDRLAAGPWRPDDDLVLRRVRRQWRRLDAALADAERSADGPGRDAALHEARKQARRARYASELVGSPAALRSATLAEAVQDALGAQHDAVLVRAAVDEVAPCAAASGEGAAPYEALRALTVRAAKRAEDEARPAAAHARRRKHRRWAR
jgi:CHAD domain-containing protein